MVCDGDDDFASVEAGPVAAEDPRVRVFHYPQNQGKGFAVSFGVTQARGELIGWLDADLDIDPEVIPAGRGRLRRGHCRCRDRFQAPGRVLG